MHPVQGKNFTSYLSDPIMRLMKKETMMTNTIYSELFKDILSISSSIQESDFDLYNVIVTAVNIAKNKSISSSNYAKI